MFWDKISKQCTVRMVSAAPEEMLSAIIKMDIPLRQTVFADPLTVTATVPAGSLGQLRKILEKRGESLEITGRQGMLWTIFGLRRRPILMAGLLIYLLLVAFLPSRVLFIRVEGNSSVSDQKILQTAQQCGLSFGASRRGIRSEELKNGLLACIPELQWAGVNTTGCLAVISVEEKTENVRKESTAQFQNIVASSDGVIRQMTVLKGTPLCTVGQAVEKGQILVSGFTDCGIKITATAAEAEIYADTYRTITAVTPSVYAKRTEKERTDVQYSLLIGKNLIKLHDSSGISDISCDRIYERHYLTLPGGFVLPVALITERFTFFTTEACARSDAACFTWVEEAVESYLCNELLIGKILNRTYQSSLSGDAFYLNGSFACYEMIGKVSDKEIIPSDE